MTNVKNYIDFGKLDDLEDYLQEFFDKFGVVKYIDGREFESYSSPFYIIYEHKNQIQICFGSGLSEIQCYEIANKMFVELRRIKPQIEKRLELPIRSTYETIHSWPEIKIYLNPYA